MPSFSTREALRWLARHHSECLMVYAVAITIVGCSASWWAS